MKKEVKKEVTERIKTFEDAKNETGRPEVPEFLDIPEDLRDYFKAQYKAVVVSEALNEGTKMDWKDRDQKKWLPWLRMVSGGFVFHATAYAYASAGAGYGSRLCLKSDELAEYSGRQFTDIWSDVLQK